MLVAIQIQEKWPKNPSDFGKNGGKTLVLAKQFGAQIIHKLMKQTL
jgi:hypothetical protein